MSTMYVEVCLAPSLYKIIIPVYRTSRYVCCTKRSERRTVVYNVRAPTKFGRIVLTTIERFGRLVEKHHRGAREHYVYELPDEFWSIFERLELALCAKIDLPWDLAEQCESLDELSEKLKGELNG
ncbi:MAG: hypothetical protein QW794_04020 [Thermosphaera sp.]